MPHKTWEEAHRFELRVRLYDGNTTGYSKSIFVETDDWKEVQKMADSIKRLWKVRLDCGKGRKFQATSVGVEWIDITEGEEL